MAQPVRVTEDFVRTFNAIKKQFSGIFDLDLFHQKLQENGEFRGLVENLDMLVSRLAYAEKIGTKKTFKQVHKDFPSAWTDFKQRWTKLPSEYLLWRIGPIDIDALFDTAKSNTEPTEFESYESNEFDSDEESAADLVLAMVDHCRDKGDNGYSPPIFARMTKAFDWFVERGLDVASFEKRWRSTPTIAIPIHVSDKHSISGEEGLYWLLDQALRAYLFKADAAALALCRALTEEVIEKHYLGYRSDSLSRDIEEATKNFPQLKKHNLGEKVRVSNDILHEAKIKIVESENWNQPDNLIREWILVLKRMIETAPDHPRQQRK
jgi:hypothetical protein